MLALAGCLAGCRSHGNAVPTPAKDSLAVRSERPTTRPAGGTVLFIGTSLTAGLGLDPADAWPSRIQRKIDSAGLAFHVVNAGVSGESSGDALHRLDWLLAQGPASIIVVETGANDALRGQPPDSVRANLDAILDRIGALRPRPVMVVAGMEALPNLGREYGAKFRAVFPEAARAHHAVYLPFLLAGVAGVDSLNQGDGVHPNVAGSIRVADNVWRTLKPILDSLARMTPAR